MREEYRKWAGWVTGNRYSEFTTSSTNQTQVRAEPGVGVLGQRTPSPGSVLTVYLSYQAHRPSESGM